ncbi:hypothetical protein M427DRAFT_53865 [Gonapodya prolifera JEL478]|uniref:GYF domain-containing protein n=1 Tax=Gonapodya prolifera (strain JEL478) TaxID=1344416 RepID=A0A139AP15_GONPJ|nr:hypothetical protein M427DRAFT_53865 [Gonapodya prolifera JEL478]|eukprot:KXS18489.1 hypothetical protein M427DRAFT_53865 [Gonapodya prolifera JEL478]
MALNFGPEWMRKASSNNAAAPTALWVSKPHQNAHVSAITTALSASNGNINHVDVPPDLLQDSGVDDTFKYARQLIVDMFKQALPLPNNLDPGQIIVSQEQLTPLATIPLTDKEKTLLALPSANPERTRTGNPPYSNGPPFANHRSPGESEGRGRGRGQNRRHEHGRDQGASPRDREGVEGPRPIQQPRRQRHLEDGSTASPTDLWDMPAEGAGSFAPDGSFKVGSEERRGVAPPSWKAKSFEERDSGKKSFGKDHEPPEVDFVPLKEEPSNAVPSNHEVPVEKPPVESSTVIPRQLPSIDDGAWLDTLTGAPRRPPSTQGTANDLFRGLGNALSTDVASKEPFGSFATSRQPNTGNLDLASLTGTKSMFSPLSDNPLSGIGSGGLGGISPIGRVPSTSTSVLGLGLDQGYGVNGGLGMNTRVTQSFPYTNVPSLGQGVLGGVPQAGFGGAPRELLGSVGPGLSETLLSREMAALRGFAPPLPAVPREPPKWFYKDLNGQVQGPFTPLEMHEWYKEQYFSPQLPIKRHDTPVFEPLAQFLQRFGVERPFLADADEYMKSDSLGLTQGTLNALGGPPTPTSLTNFSQRRDPSSFDPFSTTQPLIGSGGMNVGTVSSGVGTIAGLGIGGGGGGLRSDPGFMGLGGVFDPLPSTGLGGLGLGMDMAGVRSRPTGGAGGTHMLGLNAGPTWPSETPAIVSRVASASLGWDAAPTMATRTASLHSVAEQIIPSSSFAQVIPHVTQRSTTTAQSFVGSMGTVPLAPQPSQQERWSLFGQTPLVPVPQLPPADLEGPLEVVGGFTADHHFAHSELVDESGAQESEPADAFSVEAEDGSAENYAESVVVEDSTIAIDAQPSREDLSVSVEPESAVPSQSVAPTAEGRQKKKSGRKAPPQSVEKATLLELEKKEPEKRPWKSGGLQQVSFRELQEREAQMRERERKRQEQMKEEQLAVEIAAARAQEQSLLSNDGAGGVPWAAPTQVKETPKKKSLQEIIAEEERVKRVKEAAKEAQKQAAVASAVAVGAAQVAAAENWSIGNRYANITQTNARPAAAQVWGKVAAAKPAPVVVAPIVKPSAPTKPTPVVAAAKPAQPVETTPSPWTTVGKQSLAIGVAPPRPVPRSPPAAQRPANASASVISQTVAASTTIVRVGKEPVFGLSEEFTKWIRQTLRPVSKEINVEDFVSILLSFPVGEFSTVADVCADTLSFTTAIDPRKFALEFVNRRKMEGSGGSSMGSLGGMKLNSAGLLDGMDSGNKFIPVKSTAGKKKKK